MTKRFVFFILLLFPLNLQSQNLDIRLLRSINSSGTLQTDGFFRFASNAEFAIGFAVPAGVVFAGLIKKNNETLKSGIVIIGAEAAALIVTEALKYSVDRTRPFVTYPDITRKISVNDPSFPSGHTSNSFSLATSLSLEYPKWYIIIPSFSWAGTVSYSRMALGVHYPSDVLAGALIGIGSGFLTHIINKKLNYSVYASNPLHKNFKTLNP